MLVFSSDRFEVQLPPGHGFPMTKYRLLRKAVERARLVPPEDLRESPPAVDDELLEVHAKSYVEEVTEGSLSSSAQRRVGFPWSPALVERSRRSAGGTIAACRAALERGIGVNLAGGTHHAFVDHGEGFCLFNDAAIAARVLQRERLVRTVLVFDADVHQGNGTAVIFAGDSSVFTFSLHGRRNYPYRKEESDLDIELDDGTGDRGYLRATAMALEALERRVEPDLVVYLAGADPFVGDRWGRLAVSAEGLAARDAQVIGRYSSRAVPLAVVMAGGYARPAQVVADLHFRTVQIAADAAAARRHSSTSVRGAGADGREAGAGASGRLRLN